MSRRIVPYESFALVRSLFVLPYVHLQQEFWLSIFFDLGGHLLPLPSGHLRKAVKVVSARGAMTRFWSPVQESNDQPEVESVRVNLGHAGLRYCLASFDGQQSGKTACRLHPGDDNGDQ